MEYAILRIIWDNGEKNRYSLRCSFVNILTEISSDKFKIWILLFP